MQRHALLLLFSAGLMLMPGHNSMAQQSAAGTLACTTERDGAVPVPPAQAVLSCSFRGEGDLVGNYEGYIDRLGESGLPAGKRVLIWSVLAPPGEVRLTDLAGEYTGQTGGEHAKRLVGGRSNTIVLDPVTETSQIGGEPQPTVLNLRLRLTRS